MCYNKGWEIDIRKTIKKYEASGVDMEYHDSRFYRKEKPMITLKDGDRVYGTRTLKNASLR